MSMEWARFEVEIDKETGEVFVVFNLLNGRTVEVNDIWSINHSISFLFEKLYGRGYSIDQYIPQDMKFKNGFHARSYEWNKLFGGTPKKILKIAIGKRKKFYLDNLPEVVTDKLCRNRNGKLNVDKLARMFRIRNLLEQTIKDGNTHILPIVASRRKDTKELRKEFGKAAWKKICSNSFSRNKKITQSYYFKYENELNPLFFLVPTTLVSSDIGFAAMVYAQHNLKGKWGKIEKDRNLKRILNNYSDFVRYSKWEVGTREFNNSLKWSMERIHQEHTRMIEEDNRRWREQERVRINNYIDYRTKTEEFDYIEKLKECNLDVIVLPNGFTANILINGVEVTKEGQAMHHCVGMYAEYCYKGSYVVYSITDAEGKRYSTLGISKNENSFDFNQHYMVCNGHVDNPEVELFGKTLVQMLNKAFKGEIK